MAKNSDDQMVKDIVKGMMGVMSVAIMLPTLGQLLNRQQPNPPPVSPLSIEIIPGPLSTQAQQALQLTPQEVLPVSVTEWSTGNIARVKVTNSTYKTGAGGAKAYIPYTFVLYLKLLIGGFDQNLFGSVYPPATQPAGMTVSKYGVGVYTWNAPILANQMQPVDIWFDVPLGTMGAATATARVFTSDDSAQVGVDALANFTVAALPVTVGGGITF